MPDASRGSARLIFGRQLAHVLLVGAIVWIPGLACASAAALAIAAFNHAAIWLHYWCTEKPDMNRIYA